MSEKLNSEMKLMEDILVETYGKFIFKLIQKSYSELCESCNTPSDAEAQTHLCMETAGGIFRKRGAAVRYRIRLSNHNNIWNEIKDKVLSHKDVSKRGVWMWVDLMHGRDPAERLAGMVDRIVEWMDKEYPCLMGFADTCDSCPCYDEDNKSWMSTSSM